MADWILTYEKGVQNNRPGLNAEAWQRFQSEVPEHPPEDLRALYSAFDGGELNGGVLLYSFDRVIEAREHSEDSTWVFGEKGNQRLIASRKATLASHPGLALRPTWFETTPADALVFAVHDARAGSLRVYPSLDQLLSVLVPPAQLEAFGDHTYARALAAVESVISSVGTRVKKAVSAGKKQQAGVVKSVTGAKGRAAQGVKTGVTAVKSRAAQRAGKNATAVKSRAAQRVKKNVTAAKDRPAQRVNEKAVAGKTPARAATRPAKKKSASPGKKKSAPVMKRKAPVAKKKAAAKKSRR